MNQVLMKSIEKILKKGESPVTEFKQDSVRNEQIAKELGTLANFRGGKLFLGVDNKGNPSGTFWKNPQ